MYPCKLRLMVVIVLLTLPLVAGTVFASEQSAKPDKIILASPFSPLAMPMAYMVRKGMLKDVAKEVDLIIWNNPDQLRAIITQGQADFVSIPSNVAAIFYNRGVKLKLLNVSVWGVFYVVSKDLSIKSLNDMKGRKILIPFRGDQPDLLFQLVCKGRRIAPFEDFDIQYVSSPLDITMNLLGGSAENGLMIEPAAEVAIKKAQEKGITLKRVIDIQKEWGEIMGTQPKFPNAGVVALPEVLKHPEVVEAFRKSYDTAVKWCTEHPEEAGKLAAEYVKGVPSTAFTESLKHTIFESTSAQDSKEALIFMFSKLVEMNPSSIGGRLPDDSFYYK
ncbi:ABC-type nitrate/sulfonate/bicarbonate transport system, periplasmic component [Desulfomonile tiedjei DSM 6799]|uniref:ABC-type nitrate/sulfonate/bicarbonate transport system, periplasmic component n=2 Tax=Desulfomonile tiedjei TaxID=2358 RepID=I4CAK5_DESTA|nr:ABC-type nitrate/sulfonate/bicarbonate transport system, periplasmic component [Desulfomonile tiedjei DSM 6799]